MQFKRLLWMMVLVVGYYASGVASGNEEDQPQRFKAGTSLEQVLQHRSRLRGTYNWMAAEDAKHDAEFILIRKDENYIGKGSATIPASGKSRPLFNVNARIDEADGKQRLLLTVAGMHFRLSPSPDDPSLLTGGWSTGKRGDDRLFPAELRVIESLSQEQIEKHHHEAKTLFTEGMRNEATFHGFVHAAPLGPFMEVPVTLQLNGQDGSLRGKATFPTMEVVLNAETSLTHSDDGPRLQMRFPSIAKQGYANARSFAWQMRQPTWTLGVTRLEPRIRLEGTTMIPASRDHVYLEKTSPERQEHLHQRLLDALAKPTVVDVTVPTGIGGRTTRIELQAKDDRVTGRLTEGGMNLRAAPNATYTGRIEERDGWVTISLQQQSVGGQPMEQRLYVSEDEGRLRLSGVGLINAQPVVPIEILIPSAD